MSGLVIDGQVVQVPGVKCASWHDDPEMRLTTGDFRARVSPRVQSFLIHCTQGDWPQIVRPGAGPPGLAKRTVRNWAGDDRHAGSHVVIDADGTVWCVADLLRSATYHAELINELSVGIEIAQTPRQEIWQASIDALMQVTSAGLLDFLTDRFFVQRQFHSPYLGDSRCVDRLASGGRDCVGVFGHRDQTTRRGRGDPGDAVFTRVAACRYESWNYAARADLTAWSPRQASVGAVPDGIPGPATARALLASIGRPMWVARPGDAGWVAPSGDA